MEIRKRLKKMVDETEIGVSVEGPPPKVKVWVKKERLPGHVCEAERRP